jgi:hypothetical protein
VASLLDPLVLLWYAVIVGAALVVVGGGLAAAVLMVGAALRLAWAGPRPEKQAARSGPQAHRPGAQPWDA